MPFFRSIYTTMIHVAYGMGVTWAAPSCRRPHYSHTLSRPWDLVFSCICRYVVCSRNENEQNLVAIQQDGRVLFRCCRTIYPGQELKVWYAEEYAQSLSTIWDKIWDKKCTPIGNNRKKLLYNDILISILIRHFISFLLLFRKKQWRRLTNLPLSLLSILLSSSFLPTQTCQALSPRWISTPAGSPGSWT